MIAVGSFVRCPAVIEGCAARGYGVSGCEARDRTVQRAICILAEAASTDGQVLMAADRLGLYPSKAARIAMAAFFDDAICPGASDGQHYRHAQACGAAEALLREGWLP